MVRLLLSFALAVVLCVSMAASLGGTPVRLLALGGASNSTSRSLSWLYPMTNPVTIVPVFALPAGTKIAQRGQIMTPRNDSSVFIPTISSSGDGTEVLVCNVNTKRCASSVSLAGLSVVALEFDQRTEQLWGVASDLSQPPSSPKYVVFSASPVQGNWSAQATLQPNATVTWFEAALGPFQYYLLWRTAAGAFGSRVNITNPTAGAEPVVRFSSSALPLDIVYNSNSLTNITGLCGTPSGTTQTIQVCSPDFAKGTIELPRNGTPWYAATVTPFAAIEQPHFYYYTIVAPNPQPRYNLWITNAADGWTISNHTLPAGNMLYAITPLSTLS